MFSVLFIFSLSVYFEGVEGPLMDFALRWCEVYKWVDLPFVFDAMCCMNLLLFKMYIFQCPYSFALKSDVQKLHFIKIVIFYMNA